MDQFGSLGATMPVVSADHSKTMPVYGAESRTPNHTQFRDNKTAGERLALFRKNWYGLPVLI